MVHTSTAVRTLIERVARKSPTGDDAFFRAANSFFVTDVGVSIAVHTVSSILRFAFAVASLKSNGS